MDTFNISWYMYLTAEGLQVDTTPPEAILRDKVGTTLESVKAGKWLYIPRDQEDVYNQFIRDNPDATYEDVYNLTPPALEIRRQKVKDKRQKLYTTISDPIYISYQKYIALQQPEKAQAAKQDWIEAIRKIEADNPYPEQ